ncbi:diguanylate cyclase [Kineococcus sp. LSe6-4]|uniref:Diguanylate cyclase n=1 Tax=Kineococcus halophytocola TaxID=3234027 RepID=A0ABV4GX87_9ACTN
MPTDHQPPGRGRWWAARDHVAATRAIGAMTAAGCLYALVNGLVSPETMGTRPGGWLLMGVSATLVGLLALAMALRPRRAPTGAPAALGAFAGGVVLVLCLWTDDASFGAQMYLGWPALFAAFHLRSPVAWLLTAQAVLADVVLLAVLEGAAGVLRDSPAHLVTFGLVTVMLTRAGERQERLLARLRSEAAEDALTGLLSRRAFDAALATRVADGTAQGLLLVDLDRFKAVNDTHGHPVGDAVLRAVAAELRTACRAGDVVGRLGGDEFAVVLVGDGHGADGHGADEDGDGELGEVADRIRAAVAACTVPGRDGHRLSVSVGGAGVRAGEGVAALVDRADAALYAAKRGGRDRVVHAQR